MTTASNPIACLGFRKALQDAHPGVEFVDVATPSICFRMTKSAKEKVTRIAGIGGAAVVQATAVGVPEHEVALYSTQAMAREIVRVFPHAELTDASTWFQSGVNTDGAQEPVTSRKVRRGDILALRNHEHRQGQSQHRRFSLRSGIPDRSCRMDQAQARAKDALNHRKKRFNWPTARPMIAPRTRTVR